MYDIILWVVIFTNAIVAVYALAIADSHRAQIEELREDRDELRELIDRRREANGQPPLFRGGDE